MQSAALIWIFTTTLTGSLYALYLLVFRQKTHLVYYKKEAFSPGAVCSVSGPVNSWGFPYQEQGLCWIATTSANGSSEDTPVCPYMIPDAKLHT